MCATLRVFPLNTTSCLAYVFYLSPSLHHLSLNASDREDRDFYHVNALLNDFAVSVSRATLSSAAATAEYALTTSHPVPITLKRGWILLHEWILGVLPDSRQVILKVG